MTAQPADHPESNEPLLPMPPRTEAALRVAVRKLDLAAAVEFERTFHDAWEEAVQTDSTVPMHVFLLRWAEWVALHRWPKQSARLRELERAVGQAETVDEARVAAAEISRMLAVAGKEAAQH